MERANTPGARTVCNDTSILALHAGNVHDLIYSVVLPLQALASCSGSLKALQLQIGVNHIFYFETPVTSAFACAVLPNSLRSISSKLSAIGY